MRAFLAILLLAPAITHAGAFDPPTSAEQQAERESCARSAVCRALISDQPAALFAALGSERDCLLHAEHTVARLRSVEGATNIRVAFGKAPSAPARHAITLVTLNGVDWALDNPGGGLGSWPRTGQVCPERVCRASEALRSFDRDSIVIVSAD